MNFNAVAKIDLQNRRLSWLSLLLGIPEDISKNLYMGDMLIALAFASPSKETPG